MTARLPPQGTVLPERRLDAVDAAMVARYAEVSGDRNPIHLDAAAARAVGLDGPVVQGMLVMGLAAAALAGWLPEARCLRLSARFARPVAVGSALVLAARVVAADGAPAPRVTLRILVRDGAGQVAAVAEAVMA